MAEADPSPPAATIRMDWTATLERSVLAADQETRVWMRVRVKAPALPPMARPAASVALVLDTSGSMAGEPIETLRGAAARFVNGLGDGDQITIVSFGSRPRLVLAPTILDAKTRREAETRLERLEAEGTTDLAGGLQMALASMPTSSEHETLDRIVLLSDGVPNEAHAVPALVDQARSRGMSITCLGLGLEFDETLLGQIAQRSGGRFHFLESPDEIAAVLEREIFEIDRIAARELVLTARPGPGVGITRAPGRELMAVGSNARRIVLGDLGDGQSREVIIELAVPAHLDGAAIELADLHLAFRSATNANVSGPVLEQELYVGARASTDPEAVEASRDVELASTAAEIEAAELTVQAVALARAGQLDEAHRLVDAMIEHLRDDIERLDGPRQRAALDGLLELRPTLPSFVPAQTGKPKTTGSARPHGSGSGMGLRPSGLREYDRALGVLGM